MDALTRSVPFHLERAATDGDGLTLEGYGAVFDSPTRIDSHEGRFDEVIARGAFTKTLNERTPIVQFDHGHHPLVGSLPIGSIEVIREDDHGLYIKSRLHDNWLVEPVRDAIRSGSVDGMSFRFSVVKDSVEDRDDAPLRTLHEVRLFELGPVVFPAYDDTTVGVRAATLANDPEFRSYLARALIMGTSDDEAGTGCTTSDPDAAHPADEPAESGHSGMSREARDRDLAHLDLFQKGTK